MCNRYIIQKNYNMYPVRVYTSYIRVMFAFFSFDGKQKVSTIAYLHEKYLFKNNKQLYYIISL